MISSHKVGINSKHMNSSLIDYVTNGSIISLSQLYKYSNLDEYKVAVTKAKSYLNDNDYCQVVCEKSSIDNTTLLPVPVTIVKLNDKIMVQSYNDRYPINDESRPVLGGVHEVGDLVINTDTNANKCFGWVCTKGGLPGNWLEFGQLRRWYNEIETMTYLPQASELQLGRQVLLNEGSDSSLWVCKQVGGTYKWTQQDYPVGPTSTRPENPSEGYIRYNTDKNNLEWWTPSTGWESIVSTYTIRNLDMGYIPDSQSSRLCLLKGTTSECAEFIGRKGELVYDYEANILYMHDGVTRGGIPAIVDISSILETIKNMELVASKVIIDDPNNEFASPDVGGALVEIRTSILELEKDVTGSSERLATILTSKKLNSDASEGLKPLIEKVDLLRPAIVPGLIYDNGDECIETSGGFKVVNGTGTCTLNKLSDKLRLSCYAAGDMDNGVSTVKKINVTEYSKLKFRLSLEGGFKGLCIAGLSSIDGSTDINIASINVRSGEEHELNVSSLTGEYYVVIKALYQTHLTYTNTIDVFKIWAEV